jgi:drug/metabolite transporter (DMT)-like permease
MRRRYHPMGNWRKFGLWVNAIALALMVTAGINGFQADVLQKGIDAMDGSHAMFVTALSFAIVGIAACVIAAVRTRSIPWLVAILVSVLIGLALAFVAYNLPNPYPELVIFGFALTMLGAFAYTAAGPDPEDVYLNGYETADGAVTAATRP